MKFSKCFPVISFLCVFATILGATLFFSPSWGFMDDYHNLKMLTEIRNSPQQLQSIYEFVATMPAGFARPVYQIWVLIMYTLFKSYPTGMYLLIAILNMAAMLLWGYVFFDYFSLEKEDRSLVVFLYPLSFFIFTPFWNIFMYLSLQEKFIIWFSAIALYFFKKSYDLPKKRYIVYTFLAVIMALLSKPTGIFLPVIFSIFAFLDLIFFKKNFRVSIVNFILGIVLAGSYTIFTFSCQLSGSYTSKYKSGLGVASLISKFLSSYLYLRILLILSVVFFLFFLFQSVRKKRSSSAFSVLFPLGLIVYLSILIPWGVQTYLQCALSPLVFGMFVPIFMFFYKKNIFFKYLSMCIFISFIAVIVIGIIIPRIQKMAEKGYVVEFIKADCQQNGDARYFYPPPFMETAYALEGLSHQEVIFMNEGILPEDLINGRNFILVDDQARPVILHDLKVETPIYQSNTWKVLPLQVSLGSSQEVKGNFPKNIMQKFKLFIREL